MIVTFDRQNIFFILQAPCKHSWLLCDTVEDQLVDYFRVKRPNVVYLSVCDNVLESFC